jgi:hypothetical protein
MPRYGRVRGVWIGAVLVAGMALTSSGCLFVAAGAAAGGGAAAGYAYYKGLVTREYVANVDDVWAATHAALADLGMPVSHEERANGGASLESRTADGDRVRISFDVAPSRIPAEGSLTRVGVRVATFGDVAVSERILDQIGAHLVPGARPAPPPAGAPAETPPPPLAGASPPPNAPTKWQPQSKAPPSP